LLYGLSTQDVPECPGIPPIFFSPCLLFRGKITLSIEVKPWSLSI